MRFSELDGAAIGVWGFGRETRSLIDQVGRRLPGARIAVLADQAPLSGEARAAVGPGTRLAGPDDLGAALGSCDVIVRSPGVSIYRPELEAARAAGVVVTTATSLWLAEPTGATVIGITGTKGKSTTSLLTAHLARAAGKTVELAGNVGRPALDLLDADPAEVVVLELSSYQTADLATGPSVAVFTNLYSEHIPWHGDLATYKDDKLRLADLPGVRAVVANGRDLELAEGLEGTEAPISWFGLPGGYDLGEEGVIDGARLVARTGDLPLPGEHNALNVCAALEALRAAGIAAPPLPAAFAGFEALPHRLEVLGDFAGLRWVNDSISTTPESTIAGLDAFRTGGPITLIAGGLDREQDFAALGAVLADRGIRLVTLPDTGPSIAAAARAAGLDAALITETGDLPTAVARAAAESEAGTVVLLSPAGASQPHFKDFEERGELLRRLVRELAPQAG